MVLTLNSLISGNEKFFSLIHKGKVLYNSQLSNGNFVSTSADKTIKITNPVTKEILTLDDHKNWVWKVIEYKGKLISISWDNTLKVWKKDGNNYVVEDTIEIKGNPFDIVALSDSEFDVAVCVDADKSLRFINLSNKNEKVIDGVVVNVEKFGEIMFVKENVLFVASKNNLYLIDIKTKQILNKLENNESKIEKILVENDLIFATAIKKDNSKKMILFQISNNTIKKLNENESKMNLK
jgi:WD40 repeat protein